MRKGDIQQHLINPDTISTLIRDTLCNLLLKKGQFKTKLLAGPLQLDIGVLQFAKLDFLLMFATRMYMPMMRRQYTILSKKFSMHVNIYFLWNRGLNIPTSYILKEIKELFMRVKISVSMSIDWNISYLSITSHSLINLLLSCLFSTLKC